MKRRGKGYHAGTEECRSCKSCSCLLGIEPYAIILKPMEFGLQWRIEHEEILTGRF